MSFGKMLQEVAARGAMDYIKGALQEDAEAGQLETSLYFDNDTEFKLNNFNGYSPLVGKSGKYIGILQQWAKENDIEMTKISEYHPRDKKSDDEVLKGWKFSWQYIAKDPFLKIP
jgi:hypothetical protein